MTNTVSAQPETRPLPVTLLSGFLGSGKTTLLKHILTNKENLRCAVIVNDMASINIDGMLVGSYVKQQEEKLVKLQNGCICCTLRGDLMEAVANLAKEHQFDYLVIESTGISEPMQVAETFAIDQETLEGDTQNELLNLESLKGLARLDTCVTVVDASSLLDVFDEAKFLAQKFEGADMEDDRTVTDLLCDQIEFANVIILNKLDLVMKYPGRLEKCRGLVKLLNPKAKILESTQSKVDLREILNTNSYNMESASMTPGWLLSLKENIVPETIEYGISSFVYRARRPFHPNRLFELVHKYFIIIESPGDRPEEDQEAGDEDLDPAVEDVEDEELNEDGDIEENDEEAMNNEIEQEDANKRLKARKRSPFKGLFRSKGFIWIATRPKSMGEWAQAGQVLTIENQGNWYCDVPRESELWPTDPEVEASILADFDDDEAIGDKRQEIVFIGQFDEKDKDGIIKKLNSCLVTSKEWKQCQANNMENWVDPWEEWFFTDFMDVEEEEEEEEEKDNDVER